MGAEKNKKPEIYSYEWTSGSVSNGSAFEYNQATVIVVGLLLNITKNVRFALPSG